MSIWAQMSGEFSFKENRHFSMKNSIKEYFKKHDFVYKPEVNNSSTFFKFTIDLRAEATEAHKLFMGFLDKVKKDFPDVRADVTISIRVLI